MDGSSLSLIVIPIVVVISLAAWLSQVAYAASHPQWKHQQPASGPAPAAPAAHAVAEDDAPAEQVDQVLVA
jgi:hypothetical protein